MIHGAGRPLPGLPAAPVFPWRHEPAVRNSPPDRCRISAWVQVWRLRLPSAKGVLFQPEGQDQTSSGASPLAHQLSHRNRQPLQTYYRVDTAAVSPFNKFVMTVVFGRTGASFARSAPIQGRDTRLAGDGCPFGIASSTGPKNVSLIGRLFCSAIYINQRGKALEGCNSAPIRNGSFDRSDDD